MSKRSEIEQKIMSLQSLQELVVSWKAAGETIVFTNGCFDLLHFGHVDYLYRAADLGTKLVVALNTDDSVSRLKGPNRPIQSETSRGLVMAGLGCVDAVCFFEEPTPAQLIEALMPHVLVKGADYTPDQIVGARVVLAAGGRVETVPLSSGYSTSAIETRILQGR